MLLSWIEIPYDAYNKKLIEFKMLNDPDSDLIHIKRGYIEQHLRLDWIRLDCQTLPYVASN